MIYEFSSTACTTNQNYQRELRSHKLFFNYCYQTTSRIKNKIKKKKLTIAPLGDLRVLEAATTGGSVVLQAGKTCWSLFFEWDELL